METALGLLTTTDLFRSFQHLEIDLTMVRTMLKHVDLDGDGVDIVEFTSKLKRMREAPKMSDMWVTEAKIELMETKLTQRLEILKSSFTLFTDKQCRLITEINEKLYMQLEQQEKKIEALAESVEKLTSAVALR